ncbi:immunity 42 family protein [Leclercia adecarboxylata]|uniref:immunity 42 family protein n=1 Tax=Leclercia adecarboxylata TaxID=83655 RepID=UPI002DBE1426|nr:immunity 42 family protein [Leclercia adecarboxylata]MEB6380842.1 immunity 42 family protein [Leclercia adecarboxylata]
MIFGNPYHFAIWTEFVPQWSESYKNGLFHLIINGKLYPDDIRTSTLSSDLYEITDSDCALISQPQNDEIFYLSTETAFKRLFDLAYPQPSEQDEYPEQIFDYCIISSNISSRGGCFFAVSNDTSLRIIGGMIQHLVKDESEDKNVWEYIKKPLLQDVIILKHDLNEIMINVRQYADSL